MTGGTLLATSYQSDSHLYRVYFEENYSKSIWQKTSVLVMMTSDTYPPCHEVCVSENSTKFIYPENEHIFIPWGKVVALFLGTLMDSHQQAPLSICETCICSVFLCHTSTNGPHIRLEIGHEMRY